MLVASRFNIISRIRNSESHFVLNLLSGHADLLTAYEADYLARGIPDDDGLFVSNGYLINPVTEERLYRQKYLDFLDSRASDEVQLFFVPGYQCNFRCSYCYQEGYQQPSGNFGPDVTLAFFRYIDEAFALRRKYITLFGGEPLLPGKTQQKNIASLLAMAAMRNIEVALVTNGYLLEEYSQVLSSCEIREVQVTLDGTEAVHNLRRPLTNGAGTFQKVSSGIDLALQMGYPVNLRVVLDEGNMDNLPELATCAIERGWTASPLFKTQLGRNYDLHTCQKGTSTIFSRVAFYAKLYQLVQQHPQLLLFHKPAFSVSRFLQEHGMLPLPLFDSCPGTKTEWAFDYTGSIYACTATVGKTGEALGRFYPFVSLDQKAIASWQDRDVLAIEACRSCTLQLACGGGCATVAKNNLGNLLSPDCRPIKEQLEMGLQLYFST